MNGWNVEKLQKRHALIDIFIYQKVFLCIQKNQASIPSVNENELGDDKKYSLQNQHF